MRQRLERLSKLSRIMAGTAGLIALIQLVYLLILMFSAPDAPPPKPRTSQVINPVESSVSDFGAAMWKLYTGIALVVALANAGANWIANLRWRAAEQYKVLLLVAVFNFAFGGLMFNLWLASIPGCLVGIPVALMAVGALIGDDTRKVFQRVETGKTLDEAIQGGPSLSGRRGAVDDLVGLGISTDDDSTAGAGPKASGSRAAPKLSGKRPAPTPDDGPDVTYDLDAEVEAAAPVPAPKPAGKQPLPQASGQRPAPKVSGQRPAPKVSGQQAAPKLSGSRPVTKPAAPRNNPGKK